MSNWTNKTQSLITIRNSLEIVYTKLILLLLFFNEKNETDSEYIDNVLPEIEKLVVKKKSLGDDEKDLNTRIEKIKRIIEPYFDVTPVDDIVGTVYKKSPVDDSLNTVEATKTNSTIPVVSEMSIIHISSCLLELKKWVRIMCRSGCTARIVPLASFKI